MPSIVKDRGRDDQQMKEAGGLFVKEDVLARADGDAAMGSTCQVPPYRVRSFDFHFEMQVIRKNEMRRQMRREIGARVNSKAGYR